MRVLFPRCGRSAAAWRDVQELVYVALHPPIDAREPSPRMAEQLVSGLSFTRRSGSLSMVRNNAVG